MQVWPSGAWFGMTARVRRAFLRLTIAALGVVVLLAISARAYVEYEVHRATTMLAEVGRLQIGDTEAVALPLVTKYSGFKWTPERPSDLGPRDNWISQWAYEHRLKTMSDHAYVFDVNPWGFPDGAGILWGERRRLDAVLRAILCTVPIRVRPLIGMRDWNAQVQISIRNGRVSNVTAMVLVANRDVWFGHEWALAEEMPHEDLQTSSYAVGATALSMGMNPGGGGAILNYLTPRASNEQIQAAHSINTACLTSIKECRGFCELSRPTTQYLDKHPEAATNITPPKCN
jgi:hypothetical protein